MRFNGVVDFTDVVLLLLWCKNGGKDTCIGRVTIPLEDVEDAAERTLAVAHPQKCDILDSVLEIVGLELQSPPASRSQSLPEPVSPMPPPRASALL